MRLLYVVMRYGAEVAGGAEQHCREIAQRMVERGHDVEVATTCAQSYVDWENFYDPGVVVIDGVVVRRFPVALARGNELFNSFNRRVLLGRCARPLPMQREWMRMQGPYSPELTTWLGRHARRFDCVVFITYLYWTTWAGLRVVTGVAPVLLHPTAHEEPPLRLSLFDSVFRAPDAFAFLSPEERDLVARRFPGAPPGEVVGVGVEMPDVADDSAFRRRFALGDDPYFLYVGRVDPAKGAAELLDYFVAFKRRSPSRVRLVFLGQAFMEIPARDDIVVTGFVDTATRDSALAGATALVQPSYFESFSMVLTEAFAHRRPGLVQGRCDVLRGHALRSNAALPYVGFAEFECAMQMLLEDTERADAMGAAGRAYVEREYAWDTVLDRYERLLERTIRNSTNSDHVLGAGANTIG